jgi:hypothetical protein
MDMQFASNRLLGAHIVFPMNKTDDVNVLALKHCALCKLPYVRPLPRLLQNAGFALLLVNASIQESTTAATVSKMNVWAGRTSCATRTATRSFAIAPAESIVSESTKLSPRRKSSMTSSRKVVAG